MTPNSSIPTWSSPPATDEHSAPIDQMARKLDGRLSNKVTSAPCVFPSQSGAAKLEIVLLFTSSFRDYAGNVIVALSRQPCASFATSGAKFRVPVGGKIVRVNFDDRKPEEFIHNTENVSASQLGMMLRPWSGPST